MGQSGQSCRRIIHHCLFINQCPIVAQLPRVKINFKLPCLTHELSIYSEIDENTNTNTNCVPIGRSENLLQIASRPALAEHIFRNYLNRKMKIVGGCRANNWDILGIMSIGAVSIFPIGCRKLKELQQFSAS